VHMLESTEEVVPSSNMPTSRGKPARTSAFEDVDLMQDLTTGQSVSGILHLVNLSTAGSARKWFMSSRENKDPADEKSPHQGRQDSLAFDRKVQKHHKPRQRWKIGGMWPPKSTD
jgi:hypothetical protein